MDENLELSLGDIFLVLRKKIKLIVICTLVVAILAFIYSKFIVTPLFTADVSMYVDPSKDNSKGVSTSTSDLTELNYAQKIMNTYIEILSTNVFHRQILSEVKCDYTAAELSEMIKITPVNNTEIFKVSITTPFAEEALNLANKFSELAPVKVMEVKGVDSLKIVDPAMLPEKPSNNRTLLNTLIGGVLGLMLSIGAAFVLEMMDTCVKGEDDLLKHYQLPLLGSIPDFDKLDSKRGGYKYGYGEKEKES